MCFSLSCLKSRQSFREGSILVQLVIAENKCLSIGLGCVCVLSHVWWLFVIWTVARQSPLSMEFSRQEYWNGLPFPFTGDLPNLGIKSVSSASPALAGRFFTTGTTWEAQIRLLFSRSVVSNSLWSPGQQHTRLPCPSPSPWACSNSCPLSQWCHPAISSSVVPFSSCPQSLSASGSFPMSQLFATGDQRIGASASASVLPMNIQNWFLLGLTGLMILLSKGLSGVFSKSTVWRHQFFGAQPF